MSNLPCITINRYAQERAKWQHPWIFSNEIADPKVFQRQEAGSLVEVIDSKGNYIGTGFVNPKSLISIRILSRSREERIDSDFFEKKIRQAVSIREILFGKESGFSQTYRAVFGESDGLPGLVIDRFRGAWLVEPHALGMQLRLKEIGEALKKIDPGGAVLFRSDNRAAQLEGMQAESGVLYGEWKGDAHAVEDGILFPVDPLEGQKTGFFFDQRANRTFFRDWVSGAAKEKKDFRVLDVFCHAGAWGLRALKAGAKEAVFVDRSKSALDGVMRAAETIGVADRVKCLEGDALEILKNLENRSFDAIALDPPALIPNKKSLAQGGKNYGMLNERAFQLVKAGGVLSTSSCSYHMEEDRFEEVATRALIYSGRKGRILHRGGLSADHPMLGGMKEGRYLKNLFFWVD